jgi:hypothetical protein
MSGEDADTPEPSSGAHAVSVDVKEENELTSDAMDFLNAIGAVAGGVVGLANPMAALAIASVTAVGGLLGARGAKKQLVAIAESVQHFRTRLNLVQDVLGEKADRQDVVEVVHEALKDIVTNSYASNRRRIADVVANGLAEEGPIATLRLFEKAAASLDDFAIELLKNLSLSAPEGAVGAPHIRQFYSERFRLLEGPFGASALADLVRFGLALPEQIGEVEIQEDPDSGTRGVSADLDRSPAHITDAGREFLVWAVGEPAAQSRESVPPS